MIRDPLGLILNALQPQSEIFAQPHLKAPWGIAQAQQPSSAFHFVVSGHCFLRLENQDSLIPLNAGSFVLLPFGISHQIFSAPEAPLMCSDQIFSGKTEQQIEAMTLGGDENNEGESCILICGSFSFQRLGQETILNGLGDHIVIHTDQDNTLAQLFQLVYVERTSKLPGSKIAANRLLDALLIHLFRHLIDNQVLHTGWLLMLKDPRLSQVLAAIHNKPEHPWSIEQLAELANLSRSVFCARFKGMMNQSPMEYINRWRIGLACHELTSSNDSVLTIGLKLGFHSSDVFIRNFKKYMEDTPERYRKSH